MKKYIKLLFVMLIVVSGLLLTGCNKKDNKENESTVKEQVIDYSGTYNSEDTSSIIITKDGDKYKVNISLYRLSMFDNCTVDEIKDNTLTISGKDPSDNSIKFSFNYTTKVLTVIESTWDLLPESTRIDFDK